MTWYFDPSGTMMDVYDHEGTLVAENREFSGRWSDYPDEVLVVMRENIEESNQPTAYNQQLILDAATEDIQEGTPP